MPYSAVLPTAGRRRTRGESGNNGRSKGDENASSVLLILARGAGLVSSSSRSGRRWKPRVTMRVS